MDILSRHGTVGSGSLCSAKCPKRIAGGAPTKHALEEVTESGAAVEVEVIGTTAAAIAATASAANKNRPWLICSGCSAGPRAAPPKSLANSVVPAIKAEARIISEMARE